MNIEEVREFCLSLPGVTEDSPYGPDMIVFRIEGKIFLHLPLEYADPRISIKLPPEEGVELRERYSAIRGVSPEQNPLERNPHRTHVLQRTT